LVGLKSYLWPRVWALVERAEEHKVLTICEHGQSSGTQCQAHVHAHAPPPQDECTKTTLPNPHSLHPLLQLAAHAVDAARHSLHVCLPLLEQGRVIHHLWRGAVGCACVCACVSTIIAMLLMRPAMPCMSAFHSSDRAGSFTTCSGVQWGAHVCVGLCQHHHCNAVKV